MRNSSSLDWLRFMHTPNDYRVSRYNKVSFIFLKVLINWINLIYTNSIYKTVQLRRILIKKKAISKLNLKQPSLYIEAIAFLLLFRSWQQYLA